MRATISACRLPTTRDLPDFEPIPQHTTQKRTDPRLSHGFIHEPGADHPCVLRSLNAGDPPHGTYRTSNVSRGLERVFFSRSLLQRVFFDVAVLTLFEAFLRRGLFSSTSFFQPPLLQPLVRLFSRLYFNGFVTTPALKGLFFDVFSSVVSSTSCLQLGLRRLFFSCVFDVFSSVVSSTSFLQW